MTRESITELLSRRGIQFAVHHHAAVLNAAEAARAGLRFEASSLVKTLVFAVPNGWLIAVLRANDEISYSALARACGTDRRKIRFATRDELRETFGWEPGGVAPVADETHTRLIVDEAVFTLPIIYFGGGSATVTISANPNELFAAIKHQSACIVRRPAEPT